MPALDVLHAEVRRGLPRLDGAQLQALLPIRQAVLDDVLRMVPGVPGDLTIDLGADRQVQVRYGMFHANGRLAAGFTGNAPRVTVELASQLVAWGLQRLPLPPFVAVRGRLVHIELTRVPALVDLAPLWRHVDAVTFTSVAGRLDVRVEVRVQSPERTS
jgi:hypothetical protein